MIISMLLGGQIVYVGKNIAATGSRFSFISFSILGEEMAGASCPAGGRAGLRAAVEQSRVIGHLAPSTAPSPPSGLATYFSISSTG